MSMVDNDAVNLSIKVELNWYQLGHQFIMASDGEQYQFLSGLVDGMRDWDNYVMLHQIQSVANAFNERSPDRNKKLASFLAELAERLES